MIEGPNIVDLKSNSHSVCLRNNAVREVSTGHCCRHFGYSEVVVAVGKLDLN